MNTRKGQEPVVRSGALGFLLLALGGSLMVTNVVGLWLASRVSILGTLVLSSWPVLLLAAGLLLVGHAAARRGGRAEQEVSHGR